MRKNLYLGMAVMLFTFHGASAQDNYASRVKKYIDQYSALAIEEQKKCGIPACVTLGQGILETEAGNSELVSGANNHFGIKCGSAWHGETFNHNDDLPNECFKKYNSAEESFRDHSDHLKKNPRYAPLFKISETDYASWAICLKKCGYATNPQYAQKLIKIIEDFKLQEFTYAALNESPQEAPAPVARVAAKSAPVVLKASDPIVDEDGLFEREDANADTPVKAVTTPVTTITQPQDASSPIDAEKYLDTSKLVTLNGMKAFYANKGDMLLPYAVKYNVRYPRLLEMNDLPDAPLANDMYVYLEKKLTYGTHPNHVVEPGESLFMISQSEGVQLKKLMALNKLNPNEEPVPGTVLELQNPAIQKPNVSRASMVAHKENAIISATTSDPRQQDNDYIAVSDLKRPDTLQTKAVVAKVTKPVKTKAETVKKDETSEADLADLKADLDKVVYAGNNNLPGEKVPQAKIPAAVSTATGNEFYTVQRGETASAIAAKNHISVKQLMKWNDIEADKIQAGQKLRVAEAGKAITAPEAPKPIVKAKVEAPAEEEEETEEEETKPVLTSNGLYTVQRGETASAIAGKNHITVKQLMKWNNIEPDKIQAGQKLYVTEPAAEKEPAAKEKTAKAEPKEQNAGGDFYLVQKGETASAIAAKNHITVKQLMQWNDIEADKIRAGQKLRITANEEPAKTSAKAKKNVEADDERDEKYYVIKKGETLGGIANRHHITVKQLLAMNDIDPDKIRDGQKLRVKK